MGLRLKEIRLARKLTQRKVAEHIGCSVGAYSKYETGDREPSIEVLSSLASYYDVSVDYLIGRDNIKTSALDDYEKALVNEVLRSAPQVRKEALDYLGYLNSKK